MSQEIRITRKLELAEPVMSANGGILTSLKVRNSFLVHSANDPYIGYDEPNDNEILIIEAANHDPDAIHLGDNISLLINDIGYVLGPAPEDTWVQFNDHDVFGADQYFRWHKDISTMFALNESTQSLEITGYDQEADINMIKEDAVRLHLLNFYTAPYSRVSILSAKMDNGNNVIISSHVPYPGTIQLLGYNWKNTNTNPLT
jgi:hypothetical protein